MRWALLSILCFIFQALEANAYIGNRMSLAQDSFISPDFDSSDKTNFQYLGFSSKMFVEDSVVAAGLNADLKLSTESSLSYANLKEAYIGFRKGAVSVFAGRKLSNWSFLDKVWKFGFFEPHFKWNPLFPEAQGLTGIFLNLGNPFAGISLFYSGLYLPDQGASFEIKNGKFQKANPWLPTLPNAAEIAGQQDDVGYVVHTPEALEVILNRSYAARIYIGEKNDGLFAQASTAEKPANQLQLGFRPLLTAQNRIDLHVIPKVAKHRVSSADVGYGEKNWMIGVGHLQESIEAVTFEPEYTYQEFQPIQVSTVFLQIHPRDMQIKLALLKAQGGESVAIGPHSAQSKDYLPGRLPFSEAGLIEAENKFRFTRQRSLTPKVSYTQGAANDFQILGVGAAFAWSYNWSASLEGLFVKAGDSAEALKSTAFQFENNDSVNLGLNYVF